MKLPVLVGEKSIDVQGQSYSFIVIKEQAFSLFICRNGCSGRTDLQNKKDKTNFFNGRNFLCQNLF
jgi:hypothetical protein